MKHLLWPFQAIWGVFLFICKSLLSGISVLGLLALFAVTGGSIVVFIGSLVELVKTGDLIFVFMMFLSTLLVGVSFKLLKKFLLP